MELRGAGLATGSGRSARTDPGAAAPSHNVGAKQADTGPIKAFRFIQEGKITDVSS